MARKDQTRSSDQNQTGQTGTSRAGSTGKQPSPTRDSPLADKPTKLAGKVKQSDPPLRGPGKAQGGSAIAGRPKTPGNPDPNPHLTTGQPAIPQQGTVVSRANIQYVASSLYTNRVIRGDMILPERIDDAELCNSIEIWNEMLLDPTIAGIRLWMNVNTLNDGFSFEPAAFEPDMGQDNPNEADMKEADWAHRYVNYAIKRLKYVDRDIMLVLWDLLDGARIPHKLAEVTFDTVKYGEYAGLPAIASVRTKLQSRLRHNEPVSRHRWDCAWGVDR